MCSDGLGRRRVGQAEEGDVAAIAAFEKDVDEIDFFAVRPAAFRRLLTGRVFEAEYLGVEFDRLLRIPAAVGDRIQFLEHGRLFCAVFAVPGVRRVPRLGGCVAGMRW